MVDPSARDASASDPSDPQPSAADAARGALALAWGRVATIRRTLEWTRAEPERLSRAPFLGVNCLRLLDEAVQLGGDALQLPDGLRALVEAIDADDTAQRAQAIDAVCAALDPVMPLPQAGATLVAIEPAGKLVQPRRSRRGRRERGRGDDSRGDDSRGDDGRGGDSSGAGGDSSGSDAATEAGSSDGGAADAQAASDAPAQAAADSAPQAAEAQDDTPTPRFPPHPDGGPGLEQLLEEARASAGRSRRSKAPAAAAAPARLPFHHEERGALPLAQLDGLDPDLVAALADQDIHTVADVLRRAPTGFQRRPQLRGDAAELPEEEVVLRGPVRARCTRLSPGLRRREVHFQTRDGRRVIARWMGSSPRGFDSWAAGSDLALVGLVQLDEAEVQVDAPPALVMYEAEPVGLDGRGSGLLATYDVDGVDDRSMRDVVARALGVVLDGIKDTLPGRVLERHRLLPLDEALRDAHFPANTTGRGRTRMAFEELFLLQLGVALRSGRGKAARGVNHRALHGYLGQLQLQHGITLDDGQETAFSEIRRDLVRNTPMTRLLQGEVGAGKGLVALLTAVVVVENRTQVAMVCPDSLTAERRFLFAEPLLRSVGIAPVLVGDRVGHAQADAIRRGEAHIVFGTRSLLSNDVEWRRLGLVVAEERDHYGTVGPGSLGGRPQRPDLLVLTTAPIPTSLTFSVFGEFDLSLVPRRSGARAVPRVFAGTERSEAYAQVRGQIAQGHQAYVVFPVAKGRDLLGVEDARRFAEALRTELLPDVRLAIYSSAMSRDERFRVFDDFRHRRIDVLVSTTYVEDAPAVDNATSMVIEHADKHSLIRLYRLRGHLRHGTCSFVLGEPPGEDGRRLVELAAQESDGYRLAEIDLQVRGVEALLGDRATEAPQLDWADPPEDRALLLRARDEAFSLVKADPELRRWRALGKAVDERWGDWLGDAVVPEAQPEARQSRGRRRRRRRRR